MAIDAVFVILLILAAFKGFSRGLIMAIFSFIAFFIGLAAALKLSATVANYLQEGTDKVPSQWWPVIAFIGVFLVVSLIVRAVGAVLEKTVEVATLGWVNKIGGFLIYAVLYLLIYSVVLFFLREMKWVSEVSIEKSVTYAYIEPWGPWVIAGIAKVIPAFKDVFTDLKDFFGEVDGQIKK
jgi:membrane protein required for colicin V production